jgi:4a-hydroxytetrahydrobiopterin dehydratase
MQAAFSAARISCRFSVAQRIIGTTQLFLLEAPMVTKKLTDAEIHQQLSTIPGWTLANGKLHKNFECKDFVDAFGKMTQVALVAESLNHHPEWFNVWNKVAVDLNTHSVQGISSLDFHLAAKINEIFGA